MSIKDFEIGKRLGEGAYASVFSVLRLSDGKEYAMKVIKMNGLSNRERENAVNEVRLLASLQCEQVVRYKEAFLEGSSLHVIMEFCENGDLLKFIRDRKKKGIRLSENEIINYSIQLIEGLSKLHDLKIVHRDLKCANIMLSS